MSAPVTDHDFDKAYQAPFTLWGDIRIPGEIKKLSSEFRHAAILELGCGIGRFTSYMAEQGHKATGIDFSSVAIEKAKKRQQKSAVKADFHVADVTDISFLPDCYDASFDIGCFHCLSSEKQPFYISSLSKRLKSGAQHLIWAMNKGPSDLVYSQEYIENLFKEYFTLIQAKKSFRRFAPSHWYYLKRKE